MLRALLKMITLFRRLTMAKLVPCARPVNFCYDFCYHHGAKHLPYFIEEAMSDSPLRVGVIGCGAIAQIMHIPHLVEYEQFQLVALADSARPVLDAVADRYHVANRYTDWREMLVRPDIDAVVIAHSG